MGHFFKYLFITLFLFAALNLFRSNLDVLVSLKFDLPLLFSWYAPPIALNYLLLVAFSAGLLFAALIGAFRLMDVHYQKKQIKKLREEMKVSSAVHSGDHQLPPLAG